MKHRLFETDYGYFTADGRAYVVKRADTPTPWVNVIANERYGLVFSQAGGGFSWVDHSALSVLTRWEMDLARDAWGKWLYVRDRENGALWSASPQPTMAQAGRYECIHAIGFSRMTMSVGGVETEWTLTVPAPDEETGETPTLELWRLRIRNQGKRARRLEICSHLLWCLGAAPDSKREFHRLFIENEFDARAGCILAKKHLWEVPTEKHGHWNASWPHVAFHAVWEPGRLGAPEGLTAAGDHELFVGRHGDWRNPAWLSQENAASGGFGRYEDAVAALRLPVDLAPDEEREIVFALGVSANAELVETVLEPFRKKGAMDRALDGVGKLWAAQLDGVKVETPDPAFNILNNTWLAYQAIAGRLWARTGYWQQSGAFGFRDQLQDSQVFLPHAPDRCARQIRLHARHQFADGSVYHWWHPLSEVGLRTKMTDDLLWLPFVLTHYLKETGDYAALEGREPFVDERGATTLWDHGSRAIERVLTRFSPRGLPLIGAGDWNDGLSACGLEEKGESVWLAHFLHKVLRDWSEIGERTGRTMEVARWRERAAALRAAVNEHAWDGEWYWRASLDDGTLIGSRACREGRIYLNAQTWAVLAETADRTRGEQAMDAVERHLLRDFGPILFSPAYTSPDARIGYLTRYAAGTRENGGLYTHAATWAIQAACKMGRAQTAWEMFSRLAPPNRGMRPDHYRVEPYVTPGNVDGPESPYYGRGGWTWYTGSAAWLRRICHEWILGVRPDWDGLLIDPCLPPGWKEARFSRPYRGDRFEVAFEDPGGTGGRIAALEVDGEDHPLGEAIPASGAGRTHRIRAIVARDAQSPEPRKKGACRA